MTVVITGANRGIGRALYDHYVEKCFDVIGTRRDGAAEPGWQTLDVRDPAQHKALAESISDTPVSLLICNAGVYLDRGARLEDGYDAALWADGLATNVTGVFLIIQALLPNLRLARGKIAIISSQMASTTHAPGGSYIYRASKAAVLNLGRNLATDLATEGIPVGIYHPGWVQTDMGGNSAAITVDQSARGLKDRFDALSIDTTGCFETWDGRPHAY